MRCFSPTRVLVVLFALALPVVTVTFTRPGAQEPQSAAKADEAAPAVKKEDLRYDGKPFAYWQEYVLTELKVERRLEGVRAMAAFGANGHGTEAAETILELIKGYRPEDVLSQYASGDSKDGTGEGKLIEAALVAIVRAGEPAVPLILRSLNSETERGFAQRALEALPVPAAAAPTLVTLVQSKEPAVRSLALRTIRVNLKGIKPSLLAALAKSETIDAFVKSLASDMRDGDEEACRRAFEIAGALGPRAKGVAPEMIEILRAGIDRTTPSSTASVASTNLSPLTPAQGPPPIPESRIAEQLGQTTNYALWATAKISPAGRDVMPALLKLLKDSPAGSEKQLRCIYVLGQIGPAAKQALPALKEVLLSAPPEQREIITAAIQRIRGDKGKPAADAPQGR